MCPFDQISLESSIHSLCTGWPFQFQNEPYQLTLAPGSHSALGPYGHFLPRVRPETLQATVCAKNLIHLRYRQSRIRRTSTASPPVSWSQAQCVHVFSTSWVRIVDFCWVRQVAIETTPLHASAFEPFVLGLPFGC